MIFFFFSGVILYLISYLEASYTLNVISVFFFCCYILYLIKDKNFFAVSLFFLCFLFITALICCIAEFGGYLAEIQENSYLTGATARNVSLAFFTIYFAHLSFSFFLNKIPNIYMKTGFSNIIKDGINFTYILMIITLFGIWLKYGHPNDYGLDRFLYWNNIAPKWGQWLSSSLILFMIYFGYQYAISKKIIYIFMPILGCISFYLAGEKFTGFILCLFYFIIPVLMYTKKSLFQIFFNFKTILVLFFCVLLLCCIIYFSYFYISKGNSDLAINRFLERILLQAQMWWKIDLLSLNKYPEDLSTIVTGFVGVDADKTQTGMYFFMQNIAPTSLYNMMVDNGITFTMLYPANLNYFFSFFLSFFMTIILGGYVGFIFALIYKIIIGKHTILLIVVAVLYQNISSIILMGQMFHIFSIRNLLALSIIFIYLFLASILKRESHV